MIVENAPLYGKLNLSDECLQTKPMAVFNKKQSEYCKSLLFAESKLEKHDKT